MSRLILQPTAIAQWLALVNEAESVCGNRLTEDIESYLVLLLFRLTNRTDIAAKTLALDSLQSYQKPFSLQRDELRDIGDISLILAGLFPERATKLLVPLTYFIEMGQRAYNDLSELLRAHESLAKLYWELKQQFIVLTDTLQCMRELAEEEEVWQNAKTQRMLEIIDKYGKNLH